jgi:hypothetical protein
MLKVFCLEGEDYYVAESFEDAVKVVASAGIYEGDYDPEDLVEQDGNDPLTILNDDYLTKTTMKLAEWAALNGRGYLAGRNF